MDPQTPSKHREIAPGAVVAPAPAWVDPEPYPIPAEPNPHFVANGICVLLDDSQIDLCGPERAWFHRRADLVTASSGAEAVAQFSVGFDPAFERVEVHSIAVIRAGVRLEHAHTAFFEVLRRERNMERLVFDGRLTLHVTLPDVRPGDVVETSYTLYGVRKSLQGRHAAFVPLEWPVGIIEVRFRQRSPHTRVIHERGYNGAPEGAETVADDIVDRRWRTLERPGFRYEQLTPPWELQSAALQLSEWRDWAEVAEAFWPLYEDEGALPADFEQEAARIHAAESTPAGRAAAALHFVQNAVRYLAISMGEGGYTPRTLAAVGETRYGDCKDKTKLFVQMARRLGLDACPALVNTHDGYALDRYLPTGQLFDHCIVRLAIDGRIYWLDPTLSGQVSPLSTIGQCHFGWALPLKAGVTAIERMADPPVDQLVDSLETVNLGKGPSDPIRYEWQHKFRGNRAEGLRARLARDGAVTLFKAYCEDVQRVWPKARVIVQEVISDNAETNTLTLRECYEIDDAWTPGDDGRFNFATRDLTLRGVLPPLAPGERRHEVYLGQPGRLTRRVDVRTEAPQAGGWMRGAESSALSFSDQMRVVSSNYLVIEQKLEIRQLSLPAAEAESYRKVVQNLDRNDLVISNAVRNGKFVGAGGSGGDEMHGGAFWTVIGVALVVIFAIIRALMAAGPN